MQAHNSVLDNAALARLKADVGDKTANILLQSLRQEIDDAVLDIEAGVAKRDWCAVETKAHALKSAAATFGAQRLSMVCRDIEMAAKTGTNGAVSDKLTSEFVAVVAATCTAFGWAVAA
jgi:HPt (histidine-containing phosphotransfer) domain-containing protein